MGDPWGTHTVPTRETHGRPKRDPRDIHGRPMGGLWQTLGRPMGQSQKLTCDPWVSTVNSWAYFG